MSNALKETKFEKAVWRAVEEFEKNRNRTFVELFWDAGDYTTRAQNAGQKAVARVRTENGSTSLHYRVVVADLRNGVAVQFYPNSSKSGLNTPTPVYVDNGGERWSSVRYLERNEDSPDRLVAVLDDYGFDVDWFNTGNTQTCFEQRSYMRFKRVNEQAYRWVPTDKAAKF